MRRIRTLGYCIKQGFHGVWKNRIYSLASIGTITACLLLIGVFYFVMANFNYMVDSAESMVGITVFFEDSTTEERILEIIEDYNESVNKEKEISYTDEMGLMISSVSEIVNAVTYVLIAFVSVSLIVSSIMIAVITYISVLERTKEIGILRSIGASKKDISRVFNAETLIIGFTAGVMGVGVSLLLLIPINLIIKMLTDIPRMGQLPLIGAISLIAISTILTLIAGIVPSMIAAKKDPVVSLRSE